MATDKRARQRENKALKQAEQAKAERRARTIRLVRRIVTYAVIIALVILLANQVWGGGGDEQSLRAVAGV